MTGGRRDHSSVSSRDLARWGLLEAVRREAARDQLIATVALPSQPVLEVLLSQWAQNQGLTSQDALDRWLAERSLGPADLPDLAARGWRWQQWCEREGAARLNTTFLARKAGLDQVRYWRLLSGDQDLAAELYQQLREGETAFEQLAGLSSRAGIQVEQAGPVPLEQLQSDLAALLRVSEVGVVWAPRPAQQGGWQIVMLQQRQPAVLDGAMRQQLLDEIGSVALDQLQSSIR